MQVGTGAEHRICSFTPALHSWRFRAADERKADAGNLFPSPLSPFLSPRLLLSLLRCTVAAGALVAAAPCPRRRAEWPRRIGLCGPGWGTMMCGRPASLSGDELRTLRSLLSSQRRRMLLAKFIYEAMLPLHAVTSDADPTGKHALPFFEAVLNARHPGRGRKGEGRRIPTVGYLPLHRYPTPDRYARPVALPRCRAVCDGRCAGAYVSGRRQRLTLTTASCSSGGWR